MKSVPSSLIRLWAGLSWADLAALRRQNPELAEKKKGQWKPAVLAFLAEKTGGGVPRVASLRVLGICPRNARILKIEGGGECLAAHGPWRPGMTLLAFWDGRLWQSASRPPQPTTTTTP
jgi:hypothetical protein